MKNALPDHIIVITGASSGIGAALATRLARHPGTILGLTGRDANRLAAVAARCRASGALVEIAMIDTRDRRAMADWLMTFDARHPIDCVVANAGISAGALEGGHPERGQQIYDIFDINLGGTLNLVMPVLPLMQERKSGRLVLISSLSAYAPLPDAAAYSGSKAAILTFGLALRQNLAGSNIKVNIVCPGFVTTPMSKTFRGWKPFEISAEAAAVKIERGMARNQATIAFPWLLAAVSRLAQFVPEPAIRAAMTLFKV
jgi:short-subunit dehydrogenase